MRMHTETHAVVIKKGSMSRNEMKDWIVMMLAGGAHRIIIRHYFRRFL